MHSFASPYSLDAERLFCSTPDQCCNADVVFIGSSIGLSSAGYLKKRSLETGINLSVAVLDAGPMDMVTHMAHSRYNRRPFVYLSSQRIGGKQAFWGMSAPRPAEAILRQWPYEYDDLLRRFIITEAEMGVPETPPKSNGPLATFLLESLREKFGVWSVRQAPLAINQDGHRWSILDEVPQLVKNGVRLLPYFHCDSLVIRNGLIESVKGTWLGKSQSFAPRFVVLAVGVEQSLPLIRQICLSSVSLGIADHIRIDLHGSLPLASLMKAQDADELGVAILLMDCFSKGSKVPYHLEIKVAPKSLWERGYMQSSDNLCGNCDEALWIQIQAVAAMHERIPVSDLLSVEGIPPVMSSRDASFAGEIIEIMQQVSAVIGLTNPTFALRPLLSNHHAYGAFRVGKAVTKEFRWHEVENLYVLPPASYPDLEDDANPMLKSRVLSQYAMDDILNRFQPVAF